jgi:hypothetical protein
VALTQFELPVELAGCKTAIPSQLTTARTLDAAVVFLAGPAPNREPAHEEKARVMLVRMSVWRIIVN